VIDDTNVKIIRGSDSVENIIIAVKTQRSFTDIKLLNFKSETAIANRGAGPRASASPVSNAASNQLQKCGEEGMCYGQCLIGHVCRVDETNSDCFCYPNESPTPLQTPTPTSTVSPTPTATSTPTPTPTRTPTPLPPLYLASKTSSSSSSSAYSLGT
jgi:hypothetical protein